MLRPKAHHQAASRLDTPREFRCNAAPRSNVAKTCEADDEPDRHQQQHDPERHAQLGTDLPIAHVLFRDGHRRGGLLSRHIGSWERKVEGRAQGETRSQATTWS
jgi:hypothetical protein